MRYQRFKKGGRVSKSQFFLEKSVQKQLNLNINKSGVTFFKSAEHISETKHQT